MQATLTVSNPCNENWAAMPTNENGRFCAACSHTVIDFTHWELHDIAAYLKANAAQRTCGRFLDTQLQKPFDLTGLAPRIIYWKGNWWHKVAALIVICFGLAVTACNRPEQPNGKAGLSIPVVMGGLRVPDDSFATTKTADSRVEIPKVAGGIAITIADPYDGGHTMGVPVMEVVVRKGPDDPDTAVTVNEKFIGPQVEGYSTEDDSIGDSL